ncbi:MAG: phage Gp37/Gp68 family protein [Treponema sp.]|jgi:DNA repair photolyase|nr:phage Gp37/Gp68 family protein [Treponema sp.]
MERAGGEVVALKKPTGDMYPFVDWIWNPISGRCLHNCSYCYVKRIAKRFKYEQANPHIVEAELRANLGHGNTIFVCSGCDLFARDIPDLWIKTVIGYAHSFKNNYLFQTKNPERFTSPLFELSAARDILCTTLETNYFIPEVMNLSPPPELRSIAMGKMADAGFQIMITVEPIIDFHLREFLFFIKRVKPIQVNIGADSGHNGLPEPPAEKIRELISRLKTFTRVVEKNNLRRIIA